MGSIRPSPKNANRVSREDRVRPPFFRSRQVNFAVFIDIEESFVWVDRGEYNMTGNPPDRPKKLVFWQAYSE